MPTAPFPDYTMEHMSGPIGVVPFYDKFIRDKSDLWKTALCEIQGHPQIADEFIKAYHHDYKHAKYDTTRQLYIDAEKLVQTHASQFEKPDFHGDVAYVMYRALTHAISSMQMAKEAEKPRDQIRARLAASFDALIGNSRRLRLAALNDVDRNPSDVNQFIQCYEDGRSPLLKYTTNHETCTPAKRIVKRNTDAHGATSFTAVEYVIYKAFCNARTDIDNAKAAFKAMADAETETEDDEPQAAVACDGACDQAETGACDQVENGACDQVETEDDEPQVVAVVGDQVKTEAASKHQRDMVTFAAMYDSDLAAEKYPAFTKNAQAWAEENTQDAQDFVATFASNGTGECKECLLRGAFGYGLKATPLEGYENLTHAKTYFAFFAVKDALSRAPSTLLPPMKTFQKLCDDAVADDLPRVEKAFDDFERLKHCSAIYFQEIFDFTLFHAAEKHLQGKAQEAPTMLDTYHHLIATLKRAIAATKPTFEEICRDYHNSPSSAKTLRQQCLDLEAAEALKQLCRDAVSDDFVLRRVKEYLTQYAKSDFLTSTRFPMVPAFELYNAAKEDLETQLHVESESAFVHYHLAKTLTSMIPAAPALTFKSPDAPVDRSKCCQVPMPDPPQVLHHLPPSHIDLSKCCQVPMPPPEHIDLSKCCQVPMPAVESQAEVLLHLPPAAANNKRVHRDSDSVSANTRSKKPRLTAPHDN